MDMPDEMVRRDLIPGEPIFNSYGQNALENVQGERPCSDQDPKNNIAFMVHNDYN